MNASTRTFLAAAALALSIVGAAGYIVVTRFVKKHGAPPVVETPGPTVVDTKGASGGPTEPPHQSAPSAPKPGEAKLDEAIAFVASNDFASARRSLAAALAEGPKGELRDRIFEAMLRVSEVLVYTKPAADVELYTIKSGDSLTKVAGRYAASHLQPGAIKFVNRMGNDNLRVGSKLRIPTGAFSFYVVKSQFRLYLLYEGCAMKSYLIAVGRGGENDTPVGAFTVGTPTPMPSWNPPAKLMQERNLPATVPAGDARNPLGAAWIPLVDPAGVHTSYGIHGTNDDTVIGTAATFGCVRLTNDNVVEVYGIAHPGMTVEIVD